MAAPPSNALVITLYRELLRSVRRTRAVMRPTHVVLVGECVQRFAETRSPVLAAAVKEHGPLPLPCLVRSIFRTPDAEACDKERMIDDAFGALRMMHSVEQWVTQSESAATPRRLPEHHAKSLGPGRIHELTPACTLRADNELYDSLHGLSDREAPAEPSLKYVASQLVSRA